MNNTDVKLTITADSKQAESSINRVEKSVGSLANKTDKTAKSAGNLENKTNSAANASDKLTKSSKKTSTQLKKTAKSSNLLSKGFSSVKANAGLLLASLGGFAVGALFGGAIDESELLQKNMAVLEAQVKSTGGAAGFTAKDLHEQARQLALATLQSTEGVMDAQKVMLSFKSVTGDTFTRSIEMAANLQEVIGGDLKSATTQLGKALEDPVKGINAMARSGVTFSESQKEVIKSLVATGEKAKAQELILNVLQEQYGGTARAAASGFAGAKDTLGQAFQEVQQYLGGAVTNGGIVVDMINVLSQALFAVPPILDDLSTSWALFVDNLQHGDGIYQLVRESFNFISDGLKSILEFISPVTDWIGKYSGSIAAVIATMAAGQAVWAVVAGGFGLIGTAVSALTGVLLANPIVAIVTAIGGLAYVIYDHWDGISQWFSELWDSTTQIFSDAWEGLKNLFLNYTPTGLVIKHWEGITAFFSELWTSVKTSTVSIWEELKAYLFDIGGNLLDGLIEGLKNQVANVVNVVGDVADSVVNKFKSVFDIHSPSKVTELIGHQTGEGLQIGIEKGGNLATDQAGQVANDINSQFKKIGEGLIDDVFDKLLGGSGKSWGDIGKGVLGQITQGLTGSLKSSLSGLFGGGSGGGLSTIGGGINGSGGILSQLKSGYSGLKSLAGGYQIGEGIVKVADKFGESAGRAFSHAASVPNWQFAAGGIVGGLVGGAGQKGTGGSLGGSLGATAGLALLGGPIGVGIGAIAGGALGGLFGKGKVTGSGVELGYSGGDVTGNKYTTTNKGWIRGSSTSTSGLDAAFKQQLSQRFDVAEKAIVDASKLFGKDSAQEIIDNFTIAAHKMDARDMTDAALNEWFNSVTSGITAKIFGNDLVKYQRSGEQQSETLSRLYDSTNALNTALSSLGSNLHIAGLTGGEAASRVIDLFGGIEQFNTAMKSLQDNLNSQLKAIAASYADAIAHYDRLQTAAKSIRSEITKLQFGSNSAIAVAQQFTASKSLFDSTRTAAAGGNEAAAGSVVDTGKQYLTLAASQATTRAEFIKAQAYVARGLDSVASDIEDLRNPQLDMIAAQERAIQAAQTQLEQMYADAEVAALQLQQSQAQTELLSLQTQALTDLPSQINSAIDTKIGTAFADFKSANAGILVNGSHATGLDYVPFEGERVVPAAQNRGGDNAVVREIRALGKENAEQKQELRQLNERMRLMQFEQSKQRKITEKWDIDGQPQVRNYG